MESAYEVILSTYENIYSGDKRPRRALNASVEAYVTEPHHSHNVTMWYEDMARRLAFAVTFAFAESNGVGNYLADNPDKPNPAEIKDAALREHQRLKSYILANL